MPTIAVLDAPSNLGLRPPAPGTVPGCAKAPGALRDAGLLSRLGARDAGCLVPPRYDRGDWQEGDGVFHAPLIAGYARRLADRVDAIHERGELPLVLGGECSIALGPMLALRRRSGRYGLAYVDGHSDFRHPGNSDRVGAAGGEALALVTGRGQPDLTDLDGLRPLVADADAVLLGMGPEDESDVTELSTTDIGVRTAQDIRRLGAGVVADWARDRFAGLAGFWIHLDVDTLDASLMPAVDSPNPAGLTAAELTELLAGLLRDPGCLGLDVGIYDPDLDPDGRCAALLTDILVAALDSPTG
ncbi:arginase family protein [Crossiella sp. SN42]|uniref:arginase family protein n=1 Tax=Crossiella sp. SN42 TaxID=2944808 RepID=UPI00207D4DF4|nr:arginase family protein [Crossiella sp. SN42]MCO1578281.1 arginase family protein [Crossiella sp. SN42]